MPKSNGQNQASLIADGLRLNGAVINPRLNVNKKSNQKKTRNVKYFITAGLQSKLNQSLISFILIICLKYMYDIPVDWVLNEMKRQCLASLRNLVLQTFDD